MHTQTSNYWVTWAHALLAALKLLQATDVIHIIAVHPCQEVTLIALAPARLRIAGSPGFSGVAVLP